MFSDMFKDHISAGQNMINQNLFEDQQQQLESEVKCLTSSPGSTLNKTCRLSMQQELTIIRQVERLSGIVQDLDQKSVDKALRFTVINSSVNVETRSAKLYELIENDLLGPLDMPSACIAPYRWVMLEPRDEHLPSSVNVGLA